FHPLSRRARARRRRFRQRRCRCRPRFPACCGKPAASSGSSTSTAPAPSATVSSGWTARRAARSAPTAFSAAAPGRSTPPGSLRANRRCGGGAAMAEEAARGREPEASGGKLGSPDPEHQPPGRDRETRDRERKAPSRAPMRLTEEEFESVKRYLLLDILLRVTDHDLRALDASWVKMRRAYRTLLLAIQDRILREMAGLRHLFR